MSSITYIYGLVDPRDGELRYIGKANNPEIRLQAHITQSKNYQGVNIFKESWIRKLLSFELVPELIILKEVDCEKGEFWEEYERFFIKEARRNGCKLTNISDGGNYHKKLKTKKGHCRKHIPEEIVKLFGKLSDADIAKMANCTSCTIGERRRELGIPSFMENIKRDKENGIETLKRKERKDKGKSRKVKPIKPPLKKRGPVPRIPCELLGVVPDSEIAALTGLNVETIKNARRKLKIPKVKPLPEYQWTEDSLSLLGKMPDLNLARKLNIIPSLVKEKRVSLKIPHHKTNTICKN